MNAPYRMTLVDVVSRLESGDLTSEALTQSVLSRIAEREGEVGAWDFIDPGAALAEARRRDREPRRGPLHGVPVGIKDVIDVVGMPTMWGDAGVFGQRLPERDAPVVQRLRELGAVIAGKTAVSRFGFWWPGKTRNPHATERTPGSSSSGSAAAVADFMMPLTIGTQTSGSIMRPAAFCGVVGVMPSHGWIPWRHSRDYSPTFDVVGYFTRTAADAALAHAALSGRSGDRRDEAPLRVGLYRTSQWPDAPDYVRRHFLDAGARLAEAGHHVEEVALPADYDMLFEAQNAILEYECHRCFQWELTQARDRLFPELIELLEAGGRIDLTRYLAAIDFQKRMVEQFDRDMEGRDLLMVPGAEGEAPPAGTVGSNMFIRQWMMLHAPVISLPAGRGPTGLPLAVQLLGRRHRDARFLQDADRVAAALAQTPPAPPAHSPVTREPTDA